MVAIHHAVHSSSLWLLSQQYDTVERHNSVNVSNQTEANKFVKNLPQNKAGIMVKPPQGGTLPSESTLTGMRKTLVQQQGEVTLKDPTTHAARQVHEHFRNMDCKGDLLSLHSRVLGSASHPNVDVGSSDNGGLRDT